MKKDITVHAVDLIPEFAQLLQAGYADKVFTHTIGALRQVASMYQMVWRKYASGAMVVPGKPPINSRGEYTRSIQIRDGGKNRITVYTDYLPHKYIEDGHPRIDLKPGLLRGPKAKMGKHGPYNIVSFRHGVPGSDPYRNNPMPMRIYNLIKEITDEADQEKQAGLSTKGGTSKILTPRYKKSSGETKQATYSWGKGIHKLDQTGRRSKVATGYTWKSGKYAGMQRMAGSTQRAKHNKYITFRIVSYKSDPQSWIVPEKPPIPIRQATVDFVQPFAEEMLREAIERDIS